MDFLLNKNTWFTRSNQLHFFYNKLQKTLVFNEIFLTRWRLVSIKSNLTKSWCPSSQILTNKAKKLDSLIAKLKYLKVSVKISPESSNSGFIWVPAPFADHCLPGTICTFASLLGPWILRHSSLPHRNRNQHRDHFSCSGSDFFWCSRYMGVSKVFFVSF